VQLFVVLGQYVFLRADFFVKNYFIRLQFISFPPHLPFLTSEIFLVELVWYFNAW
jgi:hypothetical protein